MVGLRMATVGQTSVFLERIAAKGRAADLDGIVPSLPAGFAEAIEAVKVHVHVRSIAWMCI